MKKLGAVKRLKEQGMIRHLAASDDELEAPYVFRNYAIFCVLSNVAVTAKGFRSRVLSKRNESSSDYRIATTWGPDVIEKGLREQVKKLPVKNLGFSAYDNSSVLSIRGISKLVWWWVGAHRATWLRKYLSQGVTIPDEFRTPSVLYRVMKLSEEQLAALKSGKSLVTNDYSSWSPYLKSVQSFMKKDYFQQRKNYGGIGVIFKLKPQKDDVLIRLTDFFQSKEVGAILKLAKYAGGHLVFPGGPRILVALEEARKPTQDKITEVILREVSLGRANIVSEHRNQWNSEGTT